MKRDGRRTRASVPAAVAPAYPPSWVDALTAFVDRLPIPWWSFYLLLAVLLETAQVAILWTEGIFAAYGTDFFQFFFPVNYVLAAFLMHFLDRRAVSSLERFRPALRDDARPFETLLYELTTLPRRPTIVAGLAGLGFGTLSTAQMPGGLTDYPMAGLNATPLAMAFMLFSFLLTLWFWFTLIYHTIHQMRAVHRIYVRETQVDLYRLQPFYALAGLAAVTSLGFAIYTYPWLADPGVQYSAAELDPALLLTIPFYLWPMAIFVWPLWGAHRSLVAHKARALSEIGARRKALLDRFHLALEGKTLRGIDQVNKALATLELEAVALEKVPTWPWPRGMFRNLLGAFLFPVVLWLIQFGLEKLLG